MISAGLATQQSIGQRDKGQEVSHLSWVHLGPMAPPYRRLKAMAGVILRNFSPGGTKSTMGSKDHDKPAVSTRLRLGPEEWGTPTERGTDSSIAETKPSAPPDRAKTVHYNPNHATDSTNDEGNQERRPTRPTNEPAKATRRRDTIDLNHPAPKPPAEPPPPVPPAITEPSATTQKVAQDHGANREMEPDKNCPPTPANQHAREATATAATTAAADTRGHAKNPPGGPPQLKERRRRRNLERQEA